LLCLVRPPLFHPAQLLLLSLVQVWAMVLGRLASLNIRN
jgi:hypothetical protein